MIRFLLFLAVVQATSMVGGKAKAPSVARPQASGKVGKAVGKSAKAKPDTNAEAKPDLENRGIVMEFLTAPTQPAAVLPVGTGAIPLSRFAGVDWKSSVAPAFLSELRMPTSPPSASAKPVGKAASAKSSQAEVAEFDGAIQREIRSSGILKPLSALGRKHDEDTIADMLVKGLKTAFDPSSNGRATGAAAGPPATGMAGPPATGMAAPPAVASPAMAAGPPGRRLLGFWDDIVDFFEDLGCGAFAAGALPGYLLSYSLFHTNTGPQKLSHQQRYFQRAAFSAELLQTVNVRYNAWFPPGFGNAAAVTMGSEIYVRGGAFVNDTAPFWELDINPNFLATVHLINHELGHSKQYAARNWNVAKFGYDYLFNYCEAGFSYKGNSMEKDAETYRDNVDKIMTDGLARAHFKKWRKDDLYGPTGYSKNPIEYNAGFAVNGKAVLSLDLSKGSGAIKYAESQRQGGTACVRVLWGNQLALRKQPEIPNKPWDCVTVKPTKAPTRKPTTRPTPKPTGPTPPPTFGIINLPDGPLQLKPTARPSTRAPTFKIPL